MRPKSINHVSNLMDYFNSQRSKHDKGHHNKIEIKNSPVVFSNGRYILDLDKLNEEDTSSESEQDNTESNTVFTEHQDYVNKKQLKDEIQHLKRFLPFRRYNEILLGDKKEYRSSDFYTSQEIREQLNKKRYDNSGEKKVKKRKKKMASSEEYKSNEKVRNDFDSVEHKPKSKTKKKPVKKRFKIIHNRDPDTKPGWEKPKKKYSSEEYLDKRHKKFKKFKPKYDSSEEFSNKKRKRNKKSRKDSTESDSEDSLLLQGNNIIKLHADDSYENNNFEESSEIYDKEDNFNLHGKNSNPFLDSSDNSDASNEENDSGKDNDGRKRLPYFLPKRYHWKPREIHHLGYYWFDGPKGTFPSPIGLE
ncbi:uncharacterized protein LOC142985532 isoform X2 [Anticarsia gemmatalis]